MRRWMRNLLAYGTGLGLAALVLEGLLRLFPVPMGLYRTEQYQRWPLQSYEPHRAYTSSLSWEMRYPRHGTTNNYGQLAPFDFVPDSRPVIVVGDSFIESQMNLYADTLQGQLAQLLRRPDAVYGFGANGLSVSDYLALSTQAAREFAPTAAAFLIIDGDVSESLIHQIGHYNFAVRGDSVELQYWPLYGDTLGKRVRRMVGDSALLRYLQLNLRFDPPRIVEKAFAASVTKPSASAQARAMHPAEKAVVDHFLEQLAPALRIQPECVALLFHADTYAIADASTAVAPKDSPELVDYFQSRARAAGYHVVVLKDRFKAAYQRDGKRLDFWPLDRHLNGRGHGVAAQAAYDELFAAGGKCRPPPGATLNADAGR
jgi:hypothetical protein